MCCPGVFWEGVMLRTSNSAKLFVAAGVEMISVRAHESIHVWIVSDKEGILGFEERKRDKGQASYNQCLFRCHALCGWHLKMRRNAVRKLATEQSRSPTWVQYS